MMIYYTDVRMRSGSKRAWSKPLPLCFQQCNDVGLMAYLGTITKTCNSMNQFINKFNVLYDRQGIGRRMRGLFF